MREQRSLVRQQLVQAAIERILLRRRIVCAQQTRHCALLEPQPVQAPLATGIDQAIAHQRLQNVRPPCPFARNRQAAGPESIKFELLIQLTRQSACTPLPRPMQLHRI